jgi:uncharacterized membrane protein YtjA (UPF0391 family)
MLRAAIALLLIAIIAAVLGFGGIAGTATGMARIVFLVAIVLAVVSFIVGRHGSAAVALVLALTVPGMARADEAVSSVELAFLGGATASARASAWT